MKFVYPLLWNIQLHIGNHDFAFKLQLILPPRIILKKILKMLSRISRSMATENCTEVSLKEANQSPIGRQVENPK